MASASKSKSGRYDLTPADLKVCDEFQALLKRVVDGNEKCFSASVSWIDRDVAHAFPTATVQDKHEAFSAGYTARNIGLQLQEAINKLRAVNPNEEERKAKRVADLKAELERLETAVAS